MAKATSKVMLLEIAGHWNHIAASSEIFLAKTELKPIKYSYESHFLAVSGSAGHLNKKGLPRQTKQTSTLKRSQLSPAFSLHFAFQFRQFFSLVVHNLQSLIGQYLSHFLSRDAVIVKEGRKFIITSWTSSSYQSTWFVKLFRRKGRASIPAPMHTTWQR